MPILGTSESERAVAQREGKVEGNCFPINVNRVGLTMCSLCWEAYSAGYMSRTEIWQCVYYLGIIRRHRDELRRIPKRDPDDPDFVVELGEGLLPYLFDNNRDEKDWFYLVYLPTRRRRLYRLSGSGKGACAPEESVPRGVEEVTNGWPTLLQFE